MSSHEEAPPLELLLEQLKSEDVEARVAAMRRITVVAEALGEERTVSELVPFLAEQVEDDDEVLLVMAEQLGEFVPLVGGFEKAVCLLDVLGSLASVEETVVRDQAVVSINKVAQGLSSTDVEEFLLPIIERLTEGDWFTSRVSACGLFAVAYSRLDNDEAKAKFRGLYKTLCKDDTPMVRRAAAKHIGNFAKNVDSEHAVSELLPIFEQLAADDQDSVRLLAIENCTAFATVLSEHENKEHILPLVHNCAEDKSWRVRNNVAREFHPLSVAIGKNETINTLLPLFVRLLQDPEAEVRSSAAKNVAGYCDIVGGENFVSYIVPTLRDLAADLAQSVRVNLAESIMKCIPKLGSDITQDHILDHVMDFMRDSAGEVRLKVLTSFDSLISTVGPQSAQQTVLPSIISLCEDNQWRVREQVVTQMPLFAQYLNPSVFDSQLFEPYMRAFTDQVSSVRNAAAVALGPLCKQMGAEWCLNKLVPRFRDLYDNCPNYLGRITVLYGIQYLCTTASNANLTAELLPLVLRASKDSVPNVKFVAAKVLKELLTVLDNNSLEDEVKPCLHELSSDGDKDVKYFATEALSQCN